MEEWLHQAKIRAETEAKLFVDEMQLVAEANDLDFEWFIEEVVKNIHKEKEK